MCAQLVNTVVCADLTVTSKESMAPKRKRLGPMLRSVGNALRDAVPGNDSFSTSLNGGIMQGIVSKHNKASCHHRIRFTLNEHSIDSSMKTVDLPV